MKKLMFYLLLLAAVSIQAQTARKLTVNLTADGKSKIEGYLPQQPTGRAIVDCPGGGYSHLSMQNEGHDWAEFFNRQGIAFFVLTYRMPGGDRTISMSDAWAAIRTVRDSAAAWGVNPYDVGIMGFSAGGHLASTIATHSPIDVRPNFQILFYPVISMKERETHKGSCVGFLGENRNDERLVKEFSNQNAVRLHETPPALLLFAADDRAVPPLTNAIPYYAAMRKAGVPVAMHVYPEGGHGFGFRSSYAWHEQMKQELTFWLSRLQAPRANAVRVACIGNSITDGFGIDMADVNSYPAQMQRLLGDGYYVRNYGVSSRTLLNKGDWPYMREPAWREALQFNPDIVVVKLGTNDSKPENWQYGADYQRDLQQMVDSLKALPSKPQIYLCTPIPAFKATWNISDSVIVNAIVPIVNKVAKKQRLKVIDLHTLYAADGDKMLPDGIHPDAKGARRLAEIIGEAIRQ